MDFYKKDNENELDYIIRLVEGKNDKIYDLDYSEIFKLAFGVELASDESRKRFYGLRMFLPYLKEHTEENVSSDEIFNALELKKMEIEKEKVKLRDQRRELKKLIREEARLENIYELIRESAEKVSKAKPMVFDKVIENSSENEGVLLISDWHFGIEVDNCFNQFNEEIFVERINKLVAETINYGKQFKIDTLHVLNLGDLISGLIHDTIRLFNAEDTVEQTQYVSEVLADMLFEFSKHFNTVKFYSVTDNHSRVHADKNKNIEKENFSKFFPWYLKVRLQDVSNVRIMEENWDDGIVSLDVCGNYCVGTHGHHDSINNVSQNMSSMLGIQVDYVFMAHFHHKIQKEVNGCEVIVNPSLIGADEYSKTIRKVSKPAQRLLLFNEHGKFGMFDINLN